MRMQIEFADRSLSPEAVREASALIENFIRMGKEPFDGETEKSAQELSLISNANDAFRKEFGNLGIEYLFSEIEPESVHFLSNAAFEKLFPRAQGDAFTIEINRSIVVKKQGEIVFPYLHEVAHILSYQKFLHKEPQSVKIKQAGFHINTKSDEIKYAFIGLNEAICDMSAYTVQTNNFETLFNKPATLANVQKELFCTYQEEVKVLEETISGIAQYRSLDFFDVWVKFHRAFYTGDLSVLRDVEPVFGKGSLRKLALLGLDRTAAV